MLPSHKKIIIFFIISVCYIQNVFSCPPIPPDIKAFSEPEIYTVDAISAGEFIMNDVFYDPKNHCSNIKIGDAMAFVEGHPSSVYATLYDFRTGLTCEAWRE